MYVGARVRPPVRTMPPSYDRVYNLRPEEVSIFEGMFGIGRKAPPESFGFESVFSQQLHGTGAVFYRSGRLKTRFSVSASGSWDGKTLTIE
jgi:hypothetical protein